LHFSSEDWNIDALVINGKCEEVTYSKKGQWTEAQYKHLLEINGGRSQWEEQKPKTQFSPRQWKRRDKVMATISGGLSLEIKTPLVEQTRDAIEKAAKEEASKLPKF
jgi:hypothetical protein